MKYAAAISAALVGRAAAQASVVNSVLSDIQTNIKAFDSAISAYGGGPATALEAAANKIDSAVTGGAAKISGGSDLALTDTLAITGNVQSLQTALDGALTKLVAIAPKLAAAGECQKTAALLTKQQAGAKALQDAVANKAPAEARSIASQLGGQVGESIAKAASSVQAKCGSAPAAPASGSSGAAAAAPASGSTSSSSGSAPAAPVSGTKTYGEKPHVTSTVPSPAGYTGAASANGVPSALIVGAVAAYLAL
jgi:ribosomal protein S20